MASVKDGVQTLLELPAGSFGTSVVHQVLSEHPTEYVLAVAGDRQVDAIKGRCDLPVAVILVGTANCDKQLVTSTVSEYLDDTGRLFDCSGRCTDADRAKPARSG